MVDLKKLLGNDFNIGESIEDIEIPENHNDEFTIINSVMIYVTHMRTLFNIMQMIRKAATIVLKHTDVLKNIKSNKTISVPLSDNSGIVNCSIFLETLTDLRNGIFDEEFRNSEGLIVYNYHKLKKKGFFNSFHQIDTKTIESSTALKRIRDDIAFFDDQEKIYWSALVN